MTNLCSNHSLLFLSKKESIKLIIINSNIFIENFQGEKLTFDCLCNHDEIQNVLNSLTESIDKIFILNFLNNQTFIKDWIIQD